MEKQVGVIRWTNARRRTQGDVYFEFAAYDCLARFNMGNLATLNVATPP